MYLFAVIKLCVHRTWPSRDLGVTDVSRIRCGEGGGTCGRQSLPAHFSPERFPRPSGEEISKAVRDVGDNAGRTAWIHVRLIMAHAPGEA